MLNFFRFKKMCCMGQFYFRIYRSNGWCGFLYADLANLSATAIISYTQIKKKYLHTILPDQKRFIFQVIACLF